MRKRTFDPEQIDVAYRNTFVDYEPGVAVLADLEKRIGQIRIDPSAVNANSAVYKLAQLALIAYIKSRTEKDIDDRRIISSRDDSADDFPDE